LILTGPKESADYFRVLDEFVVHTLGENARRHYRIIIDDAAEVARQMKKYDAAGERKYAATLVTLTALTGQCALHQICKCRLSRLTRIWLI